MFINKILHNYLFTLFYLIYLIHITVKSPLKPLTYNHEGSTLTVGDVNTACFTAAARVISPQFDWEAASVLFIILHGGIITP